MVIGKPTRGVGLGAVAGVELAIDHQLRGGPYLIRPDRPVAPGGTLLHVATGIQRLADAELLASAPEVAAALLRLLTAPDLLMHHLDPATRQAIETA